MTDAHARAIREAQASIPTMRTGTVLTDYGDPNDGTYVSLDNDPTATPVRALTGQYLAAGTRVLLVSYPPRGLAVVEVLSARAPQGGTWQFITTGAANSPFNESLVPAGTKAIRFMLCGGGGASGSIPATTALQATASSGGAGGDVVEVTLAVDGLQFPIVPLRAGDLVYQVGGGGIGGAGNGGTGGSTILSFTRYGVTTAVTAAGGPGGFSGALSVTGGSNMVAPGNFTGNISGLAPALGAILYTGQPGFPGIVLNGLQGWGGDGGWSVLGARQIAGAGAGRTALTQQQLPAAGHRYGGGASGGFQGSGVLGLANGTNGGAGVLAWQPLF